MKPKRERGARVADFRPRSQRLWHGAFLLALVLFVPIVAAGDSSSIYRAPSPVWPSQKLTAQQKPTAQKPTAQKPTEIQAEELTYIPERLCTNPRGCPGMLQLVGRVVVRLGEIHLRAGRMVLKVDRRGQPMWAEASEGVQLVFAGREARARLAQLTLNPQRIVLSQQARLSWGATQLYGDRVEIDIAQGRVIVQRAKVTLDGFQTPLPVALGGAQTGVP